MVKAYSTLFASMYLRRRGVVATTHAQHDGSLCIGRVIVVKLKAEVAPQTRILPNEGCLALRRCYTTLFVLNFGRVEILV
jgi:hypothetical protein